MRNITLALLFFATCANAQTKKEMKEILYNYSKSVVMNVSYNVPKEKLWDAILITMRSEYSNIRRESESKGYIEGSLETDLIREAFAIEIMGDASPYQLSFSLRLDRRNRDFNGQYSNWQTINGIPEEFLYRVQFKIYKQLYGGHPWPQYIIDRIDSYNAAQKKDKNKLVQGRDY